jgi:cell division protein FtsL
MPKSDSALQKIESHEKLCRIMQKQTHDKIHNLEKAVARIEKIMLTSAGVLITGMAGIILVLITKTW